ncbi:MAG: hypothetical protein K1X26_11240 [Chitinophagales bacterium]|jgi:hypothetical protein|nr:hypothetical protein [Chitinophagales bacterium]
MFFYPNLNVRVTEKYSIVKKRSKQFMVYFFMITFFSLFLQRIFGTIGLWYKRKYLQNLDPHESFFIFFIEKAFSRIILEPSLWIKPLENADNCRDFSVFQKANIYIYISNALSIVMAGCVLAMITIDIF